MSKQLVLVFLSVVTLICAACKDSTPVSNPDSKKVRVQLNWFPEPEFAGFYEAKRRGLFKTAGLDVELLKGGPDVPAPQMAASGRVEFAIVSGPQLLTLRSQGGGITAVFSTFQKYPRGIAVRGNSKYETLQQLWKSTATVMGQDGLAFMKWLNLKFGGKQLVFVPYGGSLAPFISGKVDAMQCFATAEPVQLEVDGIPTKVFLLADTGYDPYVTVLAVNDSVLEKHPEMVSAFVGALREGWRSYLDAPQKTNELLHELNPDMVPGVLKLASSRLAGFVESELTRKKAIGWMEEQRWNTLANQLVELGELEADSAKRAGTVFFNAPIEAGSYGRGR